MVVLGALPPKPPGLMPCFYCGLPLNKKKTWDHLLPKIKGGVNLPANLVVACKNCNVAKGRMTVEQYRAFHLARMNYESFKSNVFVVFHGLRFWGEAKCRSSIPTTKVSLFAATPSVLARTSAPAASSTNSSA